MLSIDPQNHLLSAAKFVPSQHCDDRPSGIAVDMIVIHNISLPPGQFKSGAVESFFCGNLDYTAHPYFQSIANLRVSSHLFIERDGNMIQFVPFSKRAWHAGQSFFQGRERCNDFSIGIELEGTDHVPFEKIQYQQLASVIKILMKMYPDITEKRIVGHSDIAPGRKTDPGSHFDWNCLHHLLAE